MGPGSTKRTVGCILLFLILMHHKSLHAANDNRVLGSRSAALGHTSVMIPDFWSFSHNQAGLGFYDHFALGVHHENTFLVSEYSLHAIGLTLPALQGTFSLNYTFFGYSQFNESKVGLAYGRSFGEKFAAGIQLDYLNTFINDENANSGTLAVEGGIMAQPAENLYIGAHVFNPTQARINNLPENELVPTVVRMGVGYFFGEKAFLGGEVAKTTDAPVVMKAGLEYRIIPSLFVRAGIASQPTRSSFGLGFHLHRIRADVAFTHHQILGFTPHFTFQYAFR